MRARAVAIVLLLPGVACSPVRYKVAYPLEDVTPVADGTLTGYTVTVATLVDGRAPDRRGSRAPSQRLAVITRDGDDWYVTTDDRYENPAVAAAISDALAEHLRKAGVFRAVERDPTPAQLRLSGTLTRFDAHQDRHAGKEAFLAGGGLIPLVVAAGTDSRYDAVTTVDDVQLVDVATGTILWRGTLKGTTAGETALISNDPRQLYDHANVSLKAAVAQLVEQLRTVSPPAPPSP
jgi:hypothetical protein